MSLLNLALAGATVLALLIVLWAHRSKRYENFDLMALITNKQGQPDRPAIQEIIAFALMVWAFVVFVNDRKLPEWFVTIFVGAFVLRAAYSAWLRTKGDKDEREDDYRHGRRLPPAPPPRKENP